MGNNSKYQDLNLLVSKAMQGDKESFDKLCEREIKNIIYACTKLMGTRQDGEDAAQEVFINMQRNHPYKCRKCIHHGFKR